MLTGPDFDEEHVLGDGRVVHLRHIRPEDATELQRGFDRLSGPSRYQRFGGVIGRLSEPMLHYLTHVDGKDHVAIVAAAQAHPAGPEVGVGVGRFIRTREDPKVAEAALTVVDDFQRKGLGRILAVALARAALERGITQFRGQVLTDNEGVRRLLEEVGATIRTDGSELLFEVNLTPDEPEPPGFETVIRRLLGAAARRLLGARSSDPPD